MYRVVHGVFAASAAASCRRSADAIEAFSGARARAVTVRPAVETAMQPVIGDTARRVEIEVQTESIARAIGIRTTSGLDTFTGSVAAEASRSLVAISV